MSPTTQIKLRDIPDILLPFMQSNNNATLWLNANTITRIFLHRDTYRINTNHGQYRFSLDTDLEIDIQNHS